MFTHFYCYTYSHGTYLTSYLSSTAAAATAAAAAAAAAAGGGMDGGGTSGGSIARESVFDSCLDMLSAFSTTPSPQPISLPNHTSSLPISQSSISQANNIDNQRLVRLPNRSPKNNLSVQATPGTTLLLPLPTSQPDGATSSTPTPNRSLPRNVSPSHTNDSSRNTSGNSSGNGSINGSGNGGHGGANLPPIITTGKRTYERTIKPLAIQ